MNIHGRRKLWGAIAGVALWACWCSLPFSAGAARVQSQEAESQQVRSHGTGLAAYPQAPQGTTAARRYRSLVSIYDLRTRAVRVVFAGEGVWEAPNWTPDGRYLLVNSGGRIYRLVADGAGEVKPEVLEIDPRYVCNNDHGPSPDGRLLAFSASSPEVRQSRVYVAEASGRNARLVTPKAPSYFHGWSPDGRWILYIAERGDRNFDIYRASFEGGVEERLTWNPSYEDGAEYSPDGRWIYFNSDRSGNQDIWRMVGRGGREAEAGAERLTEDEWQDWFPHVSPDGRLVVFISFPPEVKDHNGRMEVLLRMIEVPGGGGSRSKPETLLKIFGGQGTINVNSWAPDSRRFAFVSYELLP